MTDWNRLAGAAMAGKAVGEAIVAAGKESGSELLQAAVDAGLVAGKWAVTGDGGENYGTVSLQEGKPSVKVTDEDALLGYVAERYPTEIVERPQIRRMFRDQLLARALAGQGCDTDGTPIPGVEIGAPSPSLVVRPSQDARDQAGRLMAGPTGLALPGLDLTARSDTADSSVIKRPNSAEGP